MQLPVWFCSSGYVQLRTFEKDQGRATAFSNNDALTSASTMFPRLVRRFIPRSAQNRVMLAVHMRTMVASVVLQGDLQHSWECVFLFTILRGLRCNLNKLKVKPPCENLCETLALEDRSWKARFYTLPKHIFPVKGQTVNVSVLHLFNSTLQHKNSHRWYIRKWVQWCSNKTLLTKNRWGTVGP